MKRKNRCKAKIILAPNPLLTTVCDPVEDGEDVSGIIRDMMHVLVNSKTGVGLAAPQAGHLKRIILLSPTGFPQVMINPMIISVSGTKEIRSEGCLSYPGVIKDIKRPEAITINYTDGRGRKLLGRIYKGFPARIIQHEIDHLNGKCKVGP